MATFSDYKWDDNSEQFDVLRDKFNNAMTLADQIPVVPIGTILDWQGNPNDLTLFDASGIGVVSTPMANFALCLGQALTGSLLKNYDGSALDNAPNRKGKFPVGWDAADGDYDAFGKTGGAKMVTLNTTQIPAHTHSYTDRYGNPGGVASGDSRTRVEDDTTDSKTTGSTGGGLPHENRPPFVTTGYIIRYK